jgi:hypothetical protein
MTYHVHFLNRRGSRVWQIPLAGTTIARRSMLVPATRGRPILETDYHGAIALCEALNNNMRLVGLPGRVFPIQSHDFTQSEVTAMPASINP